MMIIDCISLLPSYIHHCLYSLYEYTNVQYNVSWYLIAYEIARLAKHQ